MAKHFWTKSFDNYLPRAYYVSTISVDTSEDWKENPVLQDNWVNVRYNDQTQASQTRFHVISLLLMNRRTMCLYLNTILTLFRYLHFKHSWNAE